MKGSRKGNIHGWIGFTIYPKPYWTWHFGRGQFTYFLDFGPVNIWIRNLRKRGLDELDD